MKFKILCIIYFRLEDKIEFRNINDLSEIILQFTLERCKLGYVCGSLPATLFYEDQAKRISIVRAVDCSVSPPDVAADVSVFNFNKKITGMLIFQNSVEQLLVTTDGTKIWAHEIATGIRKWEVYFPFPAILKMANITRITDDGDFLFYDEYSMGTHRYTANGEYVSFTSMDGSKELKGVRKIVSIVHWNEAAKCLLAVVQLSNQDWHIVVLTH